MNNIEVSSQYYKICELEAEMKRGREQYAKAIPQYEALLDIVEKSKRAKELPENFKENTTEDLERIKTGLKNIDKRLIYIQMLNDKRAESEEKKAEIDGIISLVFLALGIGDELSN